MLVQDHFNVVLLILQSLGMATIPVNKKNANFKFFVNYIPTGLTAAISSIVAIYLIFFPHFQPFSPIHTIINFASLVGFLLVVITANCQCYFYRAIYQNIFNRMGQIENRCRLKFLAKFPMRMATHYRLKMLLIFSLFFTSQGLVLVEVLHLSEGRGMLSSFLTSLLRSMFPIAILHVVLYSDVITMFIDEINTQITYSPKGYNATNKIDFLKNVKLLHMDLWKLVGQLNVFFGWNLLVLIINSFIYITYQLYWIFLALELKWHTLGMVEGIASLLYGMVSLFVLVNSCQSGTLKMKYLVESIELYAFWTTDNVHLHHLKQEIFSQISYLPIYITGSEFFTIDRKYLAGIAANCCMYIIIFIQFFVTSDI